MDNYEIIFDDELQHWGIKGQKWGQRRYQNPDGSLTPAGVKRYNKEKEALKKEKAKVKAEEKVLANKKKTQAKIDKLEAEKKALEERKKALKDEARGKTGKEADKNTGETPEQKRERLLKSTDPKEIYKDRDALTYQELNDRVNRIDLEAKLNSRIPEEKGRLDSFNDGMKKTADTINNITNTFKKVDDAYSAVTNSAIGKTLAKQLGLDTEKVKEFNLDEFYNNMHKMSAKDREAGVKTAMDINKVKTIKDRFDKEKQDAADAAAKAKKAADEAEAAKKYEEGKKAYDEFQENLRKSAEPTPDTTYRQKNREATKDTREPLRLETKEKVSGTVEGEGTSKSSIKEEFESSKKSNTSTQKSDDYYEPIDMPMNNVPATTRNRGQSYVAGYLESKGNNDFKYVERKRDGNDWTYVYDE